MASERRQSRRSLDSDTRALSTQVGYVMAMGIIAILIGGLVSSTGGLVSQTVAQGTQAELQIIGDRIAAQVMAADRILDDDGSSTLILDADVPEQAGEKPYTLSYDDDAGLVLESAASDVTVSVPLQTERGVAVESSRASEWRIYNDGDEIRIGSEEDVP